MEGLQGTPEGTDGQADAEGKEEAMTGARSPRGEGEEVGPPPRSPRSPQAEPSTARRRKVRLLLLISGAILLLYLMISPRFAETLLFIPHAGDPGPVPSLAGVPGEDVTLATTDGVEVHAWWFEAHPEAPAVLFLHGNAGTIGDRRFQAEGMLREGISILLLSYRGYGRSQGRPSELGVARDADAALAWMAERLGGAGGVVIHGRSLGGAVGAPLAARAPGVGGVILESTFTDLLEMGRAVYPFLPSLLLRRLRGHYDTRGAAGEITAPVLVIHGDRDRLIPVEMGHALRDAVPGGARSWEVPGAGHNDLPWVAGPEYFSRVADFVREAAEGNR